MTARWPLLAALCLALGCGPGLVRHTDRTVEAAEVAVNIARTEVRGGAYTLLVGATEVTQREYAALVGDNPSVHDDCPDCPVELVNWYDAVTYANLRSVQAGLEPCYELVGCAPHVDGAATGARDRRRQRRTVGLRCESVVSRGPSCGGYRLPTRPESDVFRRLEALDASPRVLSQYAQFARSSPHGRTIVVGSLRPNAFGLYDTYGNVEEWLDDPARTPRDARPAWALETQWQGIVGGCAFMSTRDLRRDGRFAAPSAFGRPCLGFRLVRTAPAGAPGLDAPSRASSSSTTATTG